MKMYGKIGVLIDRAKFISTPSRSGAPTLGRDFFYSAIEISGTEKADPFLDDLAAAGFDDLHDVPQGALRDF